VDKRLVTTSKYLAKHLRHAPHELGLMLQPGRWVPVDDLLSAARRHGFPISYDDLVECVDTNDKQRFAFDESGELIRANHGHSVEVDLRFEGREPSETLYHGTVERFLPSILEADLHHDPPWTHAHRRASRLTRIYRTLILICLGRACSDLGKVSVKTPFSN
jgi:putative RNA 2'-phosphotransferase